MKWFNAVFPDLTAKLRRMIRREIQRDIQQSCVTHAAARQSFDLYEMRLETLDTRIAKRIMALEDRVAALEAASTDAARPVPGINPATGPAPIPASAIPADNAGQGR